MTSWGKDTSKILIEFLIIWKFPHLAPFLFQLGDVRPPGTFKNHENEFRVFM